MSPEPIRPGSARRRREVEAERRAAEAAALGETDGGTSAIDANPQPAVEVEVEVEKGVEHAPTTPIPEPELEESERETDLQLEDDFTANEPEVPDEGELWLEDAPTAAVETSVASPVAAPIATAAAPRRHGPFARLYFGETNLDFVGRRKIWFAASILVILIGLLSLSTRGLNLGIDFVGGTSWTVQANGASVAQASSVLDAAGLPGATVTILGGSGKNGQLDIESKVGNGAIDPTARALQQKVTEALAHLTHTSTNAVSVSTVGPTWGGQITHKAVLALIVFFILISIYISVAFEWRMAFAAIIAVFHDILVTVGIYSLSGFQVTPDTVVAFLTILGYSLYDTIVVFDRVRDNIRSLSERGRLTMSDLVNLSMNQTLARSINTSSVAIMPILSVLVLGAEILGAQTLQYFGLALLIGLTTGAYSSLFIASPLVAVLKEREPRYRRIRERLAAYPGERYVLSPAAVAAGLLGTDLVTQQRERAGANAGEATGMEASTRRETRPRPPAQRRPPASRRKSRGGRR